VEVLPLAEHPCDESWGYQITGFFSPTSRYGTPAQLKAMVKLLHSHDIGVIMDFVPVHFAVDDYGLRDYDGTALYEYPNQEKPVGQLQFYAFQRRGKEFSPVSGQLLADRIPF
jgi:1,4-alpha-glucan branching enzyme